MPDETTERAAPVAVTPALAPRSRLFGRYFGPIASLVTGALLASAALGVFERLGPPAAAAAQSATVLPALARFGLLVLAGLVVSALVAAALARDAEARAVELQNALDQQNAIAEILRVISSNPTDVNPVLQTVAERAAHLCHAPYARVMVIEGNELVPKADYSIEPGFTGAAVPYDRTSITGRAAFDHATVHFADVASVAETEFPGAVDNIRRLGCRAVLGVPLIREGDAYGGIFMFRREPGLFAPDQVALVETFARQAAIAIDSVRLFNETKEALEQQTAISEILRVISASPTDVQPVFDIIAERALKLCDAEVSIVSRVDGDTIRLAAVRGVSDEGRAALQAIYPLDARANTVTSRVVRERAVVQVEDVLADPAYHARNAASVAGFRGSLAVPMLRDNEVIGAIYVAHRNPGLFSHSQVELLKTFADQAVIAVENVRLLNETKEALEQQTAISEILRVISSSPTDVQPVFDIIGERAGKLCDAEVSVVSRVDGDRILLAAVHGVTVAGRESVRAGFPMAMSDETVTARTIRKRAVEHVFDVLSDPTYKQKSIARTAGYRACLGAPMLRDGEVIGAIFVARREPGRFSDSQVALLRTFADQGAIAIENVRLFNETREALDQQTAISEILRVISSSPTDVQPVLDAVAKRAAQLCDAPYARVLLIDGDRSSSGRRLHGWSGAACAAARAHPPRAVVITGRAALERRTIHHEDVVPLLDTEYPDSRRSIVAAGSACRALRSAGARGRRLRRHLPVPARAAACSRRARSRWSRRSRARRRSPSTTCDCSTRRARRSSSRRRSARSCGSSPVRRPTCSRCSTRSPSASRGCATPRPRRST